MTGFCKDIIKQLRFVLGKMFAERKTKLMSVEGGPSGGGSGGGSNGGIGGGVGAGVSVGPAISVGSSMSVGIEASGLARAAPVSGLARFDSGPAFGAAPAVAGPVNEGPLSLAALKLTVPLGEIKFNSESLSVRGASTEAKPVFSQAQKSEINEASFLPLRDSVSYNPTQIASSQTPRNDEILDFNVKSWVLPQIKPVIVPFAVPTGLEYPKPEVFASPALQPAVKTKLQTTTEPAVEVKQETLVQPALEEQKAEEVVTERVTAKQIDTDKKEEIIKKKKFVVDQPTLANRLQKAVEAVRQAKPEAERLGLGNKIVGWIVDKFLSLSHKGDISRIVQPDGPDGTIPLTKQEIRATTEFKSIEEVQTAVLKNVPVDRKEEGEEVTEGQVSKVRQDLIGESSRSGQPAAVVIKRIVEKKQKPVQQPIFTVAKSDLAVASKQDEPKRENTIQSLGLAEIFPKAA